VPRTAAWVYYFVKLSVPFRVFRDEWGSATPLN
jgi:hypothetical protein